MPCLLNSERIKILKCPHTKKNYNENKNKIHTKLATCYIITNKYTTSVIHNVI